VQAFSWNEMDASTAVASGADVGEPLCCICTAPLADAELASLASSASATTGEVNVKLTLHFPLISATAALVLRTFCAVPVLCSAALVEHRERMCCACDGQPGWLPGVKWYGTSQGCVGASNAWMC